MQWKNWSGSVVATPREMAHIRDEATLGALIRNVRQIRATGAGHSFMPLCASDDTIVSLGDWAGELVVAPDRQTVRAPAGWSLKRLTAELWTHGLALANQGDVNPQSLAGAMATGTHGTGPTLGSLASFARGFRLVGADGTVCWTDAVSNPDLYQAQRLSLGMFGIATQIAFAVIPAYHLEENLGKRSWASVRESYLEDIHTHRHCEFWMFPHADHVIFKTLNETAPCPPPASTTDMEEAAFRRLLNLCALMPSLVPGLQKLLMRGSHRGHRAGPSHAIFPSDRTLAFEEMEYEIPLDAGMAALDAVVAWIRQHRLPIAFPFEVRVVAADDIWMSPMHAGPVMAISMHQYAKMPWRAHFAAAEAIFRDHGGRPHWAKRHTLTAEDVTRLYPMAERYRDVRRKADPEGKFLNPHLAALFA